MDEPLAPQNRRLNAEELDVELLQDRLMELIQLANSMTEQLAEVSEAVRRIAQEKKRPDRRSSTTPKKKKRTTKRRATAQ